MKIRMECPSQDFTSALDEENEDEEFCAESFKDRNKIGGGKRRSKSTNNLLLSHYSSRDDDDDDDDDDNYEDGDNNQDDGEYNEGRCRGHKTKKRPLDSKIRPANRRKRKFKRSQNEEVNMAIMDTIESQGSSSSRQGDKRKKTNKAPPEVYSSSSGDVSNFPGKRKRSHPDKSLGIEFSSIEISVSSSASPMELDDETSSSSSSFLSSSDNEYNDDNDEADDEQSDWPGETPEVEMASMTLLSSMSESPPTVGREIRAGSRKLRKGFSIKSSSNEQLSRFLQDPNRSELRLTVKKMTDRNKIAHLANLYSLTLNRREHHWMILRKTGKTVSVKEFLVPTTTTTDATAAPPMSPFPSEFKRRRKTPPTASEDNCDRHRKTKMSSLAGGSQSN